MAYGVSGLVRITGIRQLKGRSGRCEVDLDSGDSLKLLVEVVLRLGLKPGQEIDEQALLDAARLQETVRAREYALDLLSRAARSERQMADRLERKGFAPDVIEKTLAGLGRAGLLNDAAYSESYVSTRLSERPMGRRALLQELAVKGVNRETAQEAVQSALAGKSEEELALQAARAHWPRLAKLPPEEGRRKLLGYLARRGFAAGVCWVAVRRVAAEMGADAPEPAWLDDEPVE